MGPPRLQSNDGSRSHLQPVLKHQPCPTDVDQGLRGRSHIVGAAETPKGNLERRTAERIREHDGSEASVCRAVRGHRIRRPRGDARSRVGGRIEAGAGILDLDDCSHTNSEEDDDRRAEGQLEQCLSAVDLHRANLCLSRTACARIGRPLPGTMGTSDGTDPPISTCNAVPRSEAQTHSAGAGLGSPWHHADALTPTRLADIARTVTVTATLTPALATVPARAPASAASRAEADSPTQTVTSTAPSTSRRTIGQARANSMSAVPRRPPHHVGRCRQGRKASLTAEGRFISGFAVTRSQRGT